MNVLSKIAQLKRSKEKNLKRSKEKKIVNVQCGDSRIVIKEISHY